MHKLKKLRIALDLTQEQLGARIGWNQERVACFENKRFGAARHKDLMTYVCKGLKGIICLKIGDTSYTYKNGKEPLPDLSDIRISSGYTQAEIVNSAKLSKGAVSKYENAQFDNLTYEAIGRYLLDGLGFSVELEVNGVCVYKAEAMSIEPWDI